MSDKEYLLENPTTSTDVWGRLERAEQRIKELEAANEVLAYNLTDDVQRIKELERERDKARKALLWFAKKNPVPREFERVVIAAHVALLGGGEDE